MTFEGRSPDGPTQLVRLGPGGFFYSLRIVGK